MAGQLFFGWRSSTNYILLLPRYDAIFDCDILQANDRYNLDYTDLEAATAVDSSLNSILDAAISIRLFYTITAGSRKDSLAAMSAFTIILITFNNRTSCT